MSCSGRVVPGHALEANLCQKHGKSDVIQVQHPSGCSVEHHLGRKQSLKIDSNQNNISAGTCSNLEEVLGEDGESLRMIADALEVGVFVEHRVVRVQEKLEGVLVEEVHLEENNAVC